MVPTVASSVDLVVHLGTGPDGTRRVEEVVAVTGRVENDVIETEPVFVRQHERPVRTQINPVLRRRWAAIAALGQSAESPQKSRRQPHAVNNDQWAKPQVTGAFVDRQRRPITRNRFRFNV